ncbi:MAG: hypothetical protein JXA96_13980 [Sedimentisphaerales bacterium]|nr:hypothetical protein [Sedimentisphaerales bacterium]
MKSEKLYEAWKETRRKVVPSENFINKVVNQAYEYEQEKKTQSHVMKRLIDFVSAHPFAQAALIAMGVMSGFMRMFVVIITILNNGDING